MYKILFFIWRRQIRLNMLGSNTKIFFIFLVLLWYATSGYLYFELPQKPDLGWTDALWWAIVTMTTVGYGDYFPQSATGRFLVGVPTMIFGIGFLGFIISEVAASLIETRSRRFRGMAEIKSKNHILIVNAGREQEVLKLIRELKSDDLTREKEICIVDETMIELPPSFLEFDVLFVKGRPTSEDTLERANLKHAAHVILLSKDPGDPRSDDQNLATLIVIETTHPAVHSIVEVIDPHKIRQMEFAGANSAVCVSELTSNLVIQELQDPGVKQVIHQLTSNQFGQQIYLTPLSGSAALKYRDVVSWTLERNYTGIGIFRNGAPMLNCQPDMDIHEGDKAILIGEKRPENIHFN